MQLGISVKYALFRLPEFMNDSSYYSNEEYDSSCDESETRSERYHVICRKRDVKEGTSESYDNS